MQIDWRDVVLLRAVHVSNGSLIIVFSSSAVESQLGGFDLRTMIVIV